MKMEMEMEMKVRFKGVKGRGTERECDASKGRMLSAGITSLGSHVTHPTTVQGKR